MTDIVERLRDKRSVDGSSVMFELPEEVIDLAIAEIMRLRHIVENLQAVAGIATAAGQSFADIKREIKTK